MRHIPTLLCAFIVSLVALVIRLPLIQVHAPYLYYEDDGHHFNRTVETFKRGSLDPQDYFNKPSLALYLRQPITAIATWYTKRQGGLESKRELRTRDPFGLSSYAYTVSHPQILYWNRAFHVLISVLLVLATFILAMQLHASLVFSMLAATITAVSPEVIKNSHLIGVDVIMALMCVVTSSLALCSLGPHKLASLLLTSVAAGLAIASKYNAGPILIIPLILAVVCHPTRKWRYAGYSILAASVSFFACNPYILLRFSQAISDITYEVWHYSVAGHAGHSQERGFAQLIFYTRWLCSDGVGIFASILACISAFLIVKHKTANSAIFLSFPCAYLLMMVLQKTNFTRNMVVLVPYFSVAASYGLYELSLRLRLTPVRILTLTLCTGCTILPLTINTATWLHSELHQPESRNSLVDWLKVSRPDDTAVDGDLQLPISIFRLSGIDAFNSSRSSIEDLVMRGFRYIVVPSTASPYDGKRPSPETALSIPGSNTDLRIPRDPPITVYDIPWKAVVDDFKNNHLYSMPTTPPLTDITACYSATERHCWITQRITRLQLPRGLAEDSSLSLSVMTPWQHQEILLFDEQRRQISSATIDPQGWLSVEISSPHEARYLLVKEVHSPASRNLSTDTRRLGVAIRVAPRP